MAIVSETSAEEKDRPAVRRTYCDYLIQKAAADGAFDSLPGTGKPLPGIDAPYDDLWWAKEMLRREELGELMRERFRECQNTPTSTSTSTR